MPGKCARALNLLADYMNKTPEVKDFALGWESRVQFDLLGEEPFAIIFSKDGKGEFENGRIEKPDVIFYCESNLFFDMMTGKVDQDDAFSNGLVEIKGSIFDSVRFRHMAELTQQKHGALFSVLRALSKFT